MSEDFEYVLKLIIVGDHKVGKTSLALRYAKNTFRTEYIATIGVNFISKLVKVKNDTIKVQIWDTAGQERFAYVRPSYYKGANGAIVSYDITNRKSFQNLSKWLHEIDVHCESIPLVLSSTKLDLEKSREVEADEGRAFADSYAMDFFETSSKEDINVKETFEAIINNMYKRFIEEV